jgi:DNA-binding Lrp family transcriptional regulator
MPAQRELMDILRERPISLGELAERLDLAPEEVLSIIEQLHKLDLFHGYRTSESQIVHVETDTIRALTRCAVCGTGVIGQSGQVVVCPNCKSEYYL